MKKVLFGFLMFAAMMTPLVLTSCDDDAEEKEVPKEEEKELVGTITEARTLDATVEYL